MKFYADLHIHSKYSIATSKLLDLEHLEKSAKNKGIEILGTGDCIHPKWLNEIETKTFENKEGLLELKPEFTISDKFNEKKINFILTTEISSIYKKKNYVFYS